MASFAGGRADGRNEQGRSHPTQGKADVANGAWVHRAQQASIHRMPVMVAVVRR
jgi:hypothetical protein